MNTILMSLLNYNAIPISISIIHGDMPRVTPETTRKIFEDIENTRTNVTIEKKAARIKLNEHKSFN